MATSALNHALARPAMFFAALRRLTGPLDQMQTDIINAVLIAAARWPAGWLAYALATAWHEARFTPQPEWGRGRGKPYGHTGKYGQAQYGRGLVQLTWDRNYEWADAALHLNGSLLKNFDRALEPEIAVRILIIGMEQGAFTGRKLADYLPGKGTHDGFVAARRIINGTDRAGDIAGYADQIQSALIAAGWA
jgi:hypothetical protein